MKRWIPLCCLLLAGCIADAPQGPPATGIAAVVAPSQFDWTMISTVNVRVAGMATAVPVRNTLMVADREGVVYLKQWAPMNESSTLPVSVPSNTDSLVVSFGTIQKRLPLVNGEVLFDFITPNPEPELDLDPEP